MSASRGRGRAALRRLCVALLPALAWPAWPAWASGAAAADPASGASPWLAHCLHEQALQPAASAPVLLRDALGRELALSRPPQRIVTIFSSNTELVAYLGLTGRIVGVEDYTRYPAAVLGLPKVGGRLGFSVDAVTALAPELVIVTPARQAAHQLVEPMQRIGVPVMVLLSRSVGEVLDNLRLVARAAGVPQRGQCLAAQLQARLDRIARSVPPEAAPSAVLITGRMGNGMLLVARPGSYTAEAVELAGARHALQGLGPLAQVSPEAVLAAAPEVLLFAGTQAAFDELLQSPGWRDLPAVRAGRTLTVARAEFLIPGPRTIDGIEKLFQALYPQRAGQLLPGAAQAASTPP
ncbi:ABC transporter substrate-binding protein [Vandammella animalimorsus]|uniref:ABC transporter substrate-binding protein n=1 Tax=Vandammella animalimorsus TaxID=2029117 RepID=UPI00325B9EB0